MRRSKQRPRLISVSSMVPHPGAPVRDQWHGIDPEDPAFLHIVRVLSDLVVKYGFDPHVAGIAERAIERGRKDYENDLARANEWAAVLCSKAVLTGSVVYYMRLGNRCKIGYSTNLRSRLTDINPEELLATEPGGLSQETVRHRQFARLRVHGEWFRYEDELVEHVESLRSSADTG